MASEDKIQEAIKLLNKYPRGLENLVSDNVDFIVLDRDEVELIFDIAQAYYRLLAYEKKREEGDKQDLKDANKIINQVSGYFGGFSLLSTASPIGWVTSTIGLLTQIVDVFITKSREYPKRINDLPYILNMFMRWAKISPGNARILRIGVDNWIHMQKSEIDDVVKEEDYVEYDSVSAEFMAEIMLPNYKQMVLKIMGSSDSGIGKPEDMYVKAAGKDDTNEIDFAKEPIGEAQEEKERRILQSNNDGKTLDFIRQRQTGEYAGGNKYDYEYSALGFEVTLEKASKLNSLKHFAKIALHTQVIKELVLNMISSHYVQEYEVYTWGWNDKLHVNKHIPLDMKEEEINPALLRFNAQSNFETLKARQERYNNGYRPLINHTIMLDLIDESLEAYVKKYQNLYANLSEDERQEIPYFIINDGEVIKRHIIFAYYDEVYSLETQSYLDSYLTQKDMPEEVKEKYRADLEKGNYFLDRLAVLRYAKKYYKYQPVWLRKDENLTIYPYVLENPRFFKNIGYAGSFYETYAINARAFEGAPVDEEFEAKYYTYNNQYAINAREFLGYEIIDRALFWRNDSGFWERVPNLEKSYYESKQREREHNSVDTSGNTAAEKRLMYKKAIRRNFRLFIDRKSDKGALQDQISQLTFMLQTRGVEMAIPGKYNADKILDSRII